MINETATTATETAVKAPKAVKVPKAEVVVNVSIITAQPIAGATVESINFTAKSESAALRHAAIKLGVVEAADVAEEYPYALRNKIAAKFKDENKFGGVYVTVDGNTKNILG